MTPRVAPPPTPLAVGGEAPDFAASHHGYGSTESKFRLSNRRGRRVVLLAFHPLAFTLVSSRQLMAIAERKAEFDALGADVAMVSVDHAETLHAWDLVHGVLGVTLLSDFLPRGRIARLYGVFGARELAHRVAFAIDRAGTIAAVRAWGPDVEPAVDDLLALAAAADASSPADAEAG